MNARRICLAASAALALLHFGCGGLVDIRPLQNDPATGAAATSGGGDTGGGAGTSEVGGAGGVAGTGGPAGAGGGAGAGAATMHPMGGPPTPSCNQAPSISLSPGQTGPLSPGTTAAFDLTVNETNPSPCPMRTYQYSFFMGDQLSTTDPTVGVLIPAPGYYSDSASTTIHVASATSAPPGRYIVAVEVNDASGATQVGAAAAATYVVTLTSTGTLLVPDGDGHFDGSNAAGVIGSWWSTGDDYGMNNLPGAGTCPADGFPDTACSVLTTPTPGTSFRPDASGRGMCTSGVSAQVIQDGTGNLAFSSIWGNIIGFNPANPGTLADGATLVGPYDAPAHGITGFAFDIDAVPPGGHLRVTFQTVGTEKNAAYWGGATGDLSPVTAPGHYEMRWAEVGGPLYLTNPPPFDPTRLTGITFQVVSNASTPVPFNFCVNNTMLLTN
jgi:hypothetical protein